MTMEARLGAEIRTFHDNWPGALTKDERLGGVEELFQPKIPAGFFRMILRFSSRNNISICDGMPYSESGCGRFPACRRYCFPL